ncbi:MAG: GNAT family N-acetyltransferase [Granulosicoccus sp.]
MKFEIPTKLNIDANEKIISETRKFNSQFVANDFEPLSVYCRNERHEIIGGLTGKTYWNYLDIEFLWVDQSARGKGMATRIIELAEIEAKQRGCSFSMLDTYEFQALDFYLKQGYTKFGQLDRYCEKYERYYLKKKL